MVRLPHRGIEDAPFDREGGGGSIETGAPVKLARSEWGQTFLAQQLGKDGRVSRHPKRLPGRPAGRLMLTVAVARRATEDGHHYLRLEPADDPHDILENRIARPVGPGVVQVLGEAEIIGTSEELPCTVEPAGREQLFGPEEAQGLAQLVADEILATFAPVEREVGGFRAGTAPQDGEKLGILVVWMGGDHEDALVVAQLAQGQIQRGVPAGGRRRELGRDGGRRERQDEDRKQAAGHGVKVIPPVPPRKPDGGFRRWPPSAGPTQAPSGSLRRMPPSSG
jgi:hypothetical protein